MTLGQAKDKIMMLLDDYMIDSPPTDDEETLAKLPGLIQTAQVFLSTIKKIRKSVVIDHQPNGGWYAEYDLPSDYAQAFKMRDKTGKGYNVEFLGQKVLVQDTAPQVIRIDYFAYPTEITADTPDTFVFELDQDAQQIIPYYVAADILKTDPSADYTAFEVKLNNMINSLDTRQSVTVSIQGGIRI